MPDNHIDGSPTVNPTSTTTAQTTPRGRAKAQLRGAMERSDHYRKLPSGAWRVLTALWELADAPRGSELCVHGFCKRSTIADRTGLSVSQVGRWLRRLRVLNPGETPPPNHLGGWIDTRNRLGRYLTWTVYSTPSGVVDPKQSALEILEAAEAEAVVHRSPPQTHRRTVSECHEAPSPNAQTRQEVAHRCAIEVPPQTPTSDFHHHYPRTTATPEPTQPDELGGGGGVQDQSEREAIGELLDEAGVWPQERGKLVGIVAGLPGGLLRLEKTIRSIGEHEKLGAFIAARIRKGGLDEVTEADMEKAEAERKRKADLAARSRLTLDEHIDGFRWVLDGSATVPPLLARLLGMHGQSAEREQRAKLESWTPTKLAEWFMKLERGVRPAGATYHR